MSCRSLHFALFLTSIRLRIGLLSLLLAAISACGSTAKRSDAQPPPPAVDTAVPPTPDAAAADRPADREPGDTGAGDGAGDGASDRAAADAADGGPTDATADAAGEDAGDDAAGDARPAQGPLLGYWPLDEGTGLTTADRSPNGNAGTLVGGATWTTMVFPNGPVLNPAAVVLDGVDDYVELGVGTLPAPSAPKTLSLWFWQDTPATVGRKNLIALTNISSDTGLQMGLDAGRAAVWLTGRADNLVATTAAVTAGWHFLAYTYDGTTHTLQLDAAVVGTATGAPDPGPTAVARLGAFEILDEMFAGRIDEVRVYDHALDTAGLTALSMGHTPP